MKSLRITAAALAVVAGLGWTVPVHADAVTTWNEIAVRAAGTGRPGPVGVLDIALVHAAMHDAVQAIEQRYQPYYADLAPASGSPAAAAAAAAHGMLVGLYPAQSGVLDADYLAYLAAEGLEGDAGIEAGEQAAAATLTQHRAVPNPPLPPYVGGTATGQWRPTPSYIGTPPAPPSYSPMALLYLASMEPLTLYSPGQFRPQPPPPLASEIYHRDYEEVRLYGARFGSLRSEEQTDRAYFWTDNPVVQWNRTMRGIAAAHVTEVGDSARLFALANLAMADALISCWESKLHYSFWRPLTAIQEGDADGNDRTVGDPSWQPLINTPNYPDYTSGLNSVSGSATGVLARFFGTDEVAFTVATSAPQAVQKTRSYLRFSDAAQDVVDARVWLGIHFRFADEVARRQGDRVAGWVVGHYLRPAPGRGR